MQDFVEKKIKEFKRWADYITLGEVEGDHILHELMKATLKLLAVQMHTRYKYFSLVPWILVHADTVSGATEIEKQVRARPLEEHDAVTRRIWVPLSMTFWP